MWWERDEREPFVHLYPGVIRFLGYEPWPKPTYLREALLAERRRRGWSLAQAAQALGVDEGTWRRWESGEWRPMARATQALSALLGLSIKRHFPNEVR
ncbi:MAG: helix-turn-helix domain-containing protein [Pseudomonadota bacterium]